jgi:hypothetical protein
MAHGYNADIIPSKAVTGVKNEARTLLQYVESYRRLSEEKTRSIIFIYHSLGGVPMKNMTACTSLAEA